MTVPLWTPDNTIDAQRAQAMIAARFPEFRTARIERLGQGWDNAAYLVGDAVFRFPQRAVAAPLVGTEIAVLPLLAAHLPLTIPEPRWVGEPDAAYPLQFYGYPFMHGTPVDIAAPSSAARERLAPALGTFLRRLHAIDPAAALAAGLPPDLIGRLDPAKRLPQAHARLTAMTEAGALSAADARTITDLLERDAPHGEAPRFTVVHGDLYARHVLLDGDERAAGVIDWGDLHFGDPAVDLAIAHELFSASALDVFRDAYGPIDEATWSRARWRATHHAVLVADYGLAIDDEPLARGGFEALRRITS